MPMLADQDIDGATQAAACVVEIHRRLVGMLCPGVTLAQVDQFCADQLEDLDCVSCFKGYRVRGHPPFPSHTCLSLNDCVVHGTHDMSAAPLRAGDLLSVDVGVKHRGWIGDAAWTYAIVSRDAVGTALMDAGRESLRRGIAALQPGRPLIDFARAVQGHVERERGLCLIRGLGGHGYGRSLHAPPYVSNVVPSYPGEWREAFEQVEPGMLLAVEPMISVGATETTSVGQQWPLRTADGSMSVHYEANVLITPGGPINLTQGLFELPEILG
ncbi:MAG: type I methionyl aminopeptidase [Planctomycetota bacterium]|nr:type I methionyl aminopeptidase [Planctomycetota bacterium]MDA1105466.1 type I methionyl aminopeptidase [Planctomycetota bacterium]